MRLIRITSALMVLLPAAVTAQMEVRGLEVSGGYYGWGGDAFDGLEAGPRLQGIFFAEAAPHIGLGLAGSFGWGGFQGSDESFREFGLGAALRLALGSRDRVHLFAGGHAGWTRLTADLQPAAPTLEENGFSVGPEIGVEIPLAAGPRLTVAAEGMWQRYGDVRLQGGTIVGASNDSGWRFGAKVGVAFGEGS